MWKRKHYSELSGALLLEYAHKHGVWLTDPTFSPADQRDLAETLAAAQIGDFEIRRRLREHEREIRDNRVAYAAMWSAVASVVSALTALVAVFIHK